MMKQFDPSIAAKEARQLFKPLRNAFFLVALLALPELALAGEDSGIDGNFEGQTCGFLEQITSLLGMASIAVVTIAIVFAGYQIAFAHKRISDVAPILIGGLLIGGAGQLARWILGDEYSECTGSSGDGMALVNAVLQYVA
jgi:type IV secretion system protein VirB2